MVRLSAITLLALCLSACAEEEWDFAYYERAEFNNMTINEIEDFVRDIAKRWGLQVYEVPKKSLVRTNLKGSRGLFSMGVYVEGSDGPVFWIGNRGAAHILSLMMSYKMGFSPRCVDRLYEELKLGLEERFGLDFYPVDKSGQRIKEGGN